MKDAGYQYVVIDDCWQVERGADGRIVADPKRFPSGMKALADYVHSKGLQASGSTPTRAPRPAASGRAARATRRRTRRRYADWGVDYLKYDWCSTEGMDARDAYSRMSAPPARDRARHRASASASGDRASPGCGRRASGQLWRSTGDIQDCWDCSTSWGGMGVTHIVDLNAELHPYAGPGHWNDPDMLEVGNGGLIAGRDARALLPVGALGRAADRGQRRAQHDAGGPRRPARTPR